MLTGGGRAATEKWQGSDRGVEGERQRSGRTKLAGWRYGSGRTKGQ